MEPIISQQLKHIESAITDLTVTLNCSQTDSSFACDFLNMFHTLLSRYHEGMDMQLYIMEALKVCCELHQADWCGIFVADSASGIWAPSEWYSVENGPMAPTRFNENEYFEDVPQWVEAFKRNMNECI